MTRSALEKATVLDYRRTVLLNRHRCIAGLWRTLVGYPLRRIQRESCQYLASPEARRPDLKVIAVLGTAAVVLILQRYLAAPEAIIALAKLLPWPGPPPLDERLSDYLFDTDNGLSRRLTWWALVSIASYVGLPLAMIRYFLKERLRDYGVKLQGAFSDYGIYGGMCLFALPLIVLCSAQECFQETYPFYSINDVSMLGWGFYRWEILYAIQFFGVEFFFRGFLLHGTRRRFGVYAILVMMVPYCMLHFSKPLLETLASVVGAIVLGFMSLKTRSIGMGTVIHVTVAWSMDLASLWRQGIFTP